MSSHTARILEKIAKQCEEDPEERIPFVVCYVENGTRSSVFNLCKKVEDYTSLIRATRDVLDSLREEKKALIEKEAGSET